MCTLHLLQLRAGVVAHSVKDHCAGHNLTHGRLGQKQRACFDQALAYLTPDKYMLVQSTMHSIPMGPGQR